MMSPAARQFLSFSVIGVIGLGVDTAALLLATGPVGLDPYTGRVFSFLMAATATWALNRRFTFAPDQRPVAVQWARFIAANSIGGLINYGVYSALITFVPLVRTYLVIGVACGSIAGLAFNFTTSKFWVFRSRETP